MGPIGCPKMVVRSYQYTLYNMLDKFRSHQTIWCCWPWFGSAWCSSEQSGLALRGAVQSNLIWHCVVQFRAIWFGTAWCSSEQSGLALRGAVQSNLIWHCVVQFRAIWFGTAWCSSEQSGLALRGAVQSNLVWLCVVQFRAI